MRRTILLLSCLVLGACAPGTLPREAASARSAMPEQVVLPPMKRFAAPRPTPPQRANRDIARDFLDLAFQMESGRVLEQFSRFEGPITVRVAGRLPDMLMSDLTGLIARLRAEAGVDIRLVTTGSANITIEAVSSADIRRHLPSAACFVVPGITSLGQYRSARNARRTDWTRIVRRETVALFVPNDTSPQETRDCLHEEIAQAIGPLNDLYRLPDSVFNDDNVHSVLTGFDMLILRAYHAPELRPGMSRAEVAARLPAILARLNPRGETVTPNPLPPSPRAWIAAIQTALGPNAGAGARRAAAVAAVQIAQAEGWNDHRRAFGHFVLGRLTQATEPAFALRQFVLADRIHARTPGNELHRAFVAVHLASHEIARGDREAALARLARFIGIAERHENAALLATLMMLQSEALAMEGRLAEAQAARLDSLGWARYGYGMDRTLEARLREAGSLTPPRR
ncbi:MAG: DUF2927 domain-containing protein [Roseovarius sp.]|nr:DUF2927 domain-containing protein [Roseovarius sp.]